MIKHKFTRAVALIIVVTLIFAVPAGCSPNEMKLLKAIMNATPIHSYESAGNISATLNIVPSDNYLPNYYDSSMRAAYRALKTFLDSASIDTYVKVNADKNYKEIKEEIILTPNLFGGQMKDLTFGFWADMRGGDPDNSNMYVKMPAIAAALSEETAGKDYISMNFGGLIKLAEEYSGEDASDFSNLLNYEKLMGDVTALMEPISNAVLKAAAQMKPDEIYVSGVRPVTGEDAKLAHVYTLSISDKGLKKLLRSIVNDIDKDTAKETIFAVLDGFIKYLSGFSDSSYMYKDFVDELETVRRELDENFDDGYELALTHINMLLDAFENIKFLGPKGVTFDIEINSDGFISMYDGIVDISIKPSAISAFFGGSDSSDIKRIDFSIIIKQKLSRINKAVKINMPETTALNTVSLEEIIKAQAENNSYYNDYDYYEDYDYGYEYGDGTDTDESFTGEDDGGGEYEGESVTGGYSAEDGDAA